MLGVLSSIPLDWYARRRRRDPRQLSYLQRFSDSGPRSTKPAQATSRADRRALGSCRRSLRRVGATVGVPVGSVTDPAEKDDLIAELDAAVALLYGLDEADVEVIFSTFHVGWHYEQRLASVLEHFRRLS